MDEVRTSTERQGYLETQTLFAESFIQKSNVFEDVVPVFDYIVEYALPIIWLRFDGIISDDNILSYDDKIKLEEITNNLETLPPNELATLLVDLLGSSSNIYTNIEDQVTIGSSPTTSWVSVYFPKAGSPSYSLTTIQDPMRVSRVWDNLQRANIDTTYHIDNQEVLEFEIKPEDLYIGYENMGYSYVLKCDDAEPVVLNMVISFITSNVSFESLLTKNSRSLSFKADEKMSFARRDEKRDFLMLNKSYTNRSVTAGFLRPQEIENNNSKPHIWLNHHDEGRGLSPFMTIRIEEQEVYSSLLESGQTPVDFYNTVDGVMISMEIESNSSDILWVPGCQ